MRFFLLCGLLLLPGCAELAEMKAAQQAEIEFNKKQYCANLGAPEGSENYFNCRQTLEGQLIQQAQAAQQQEFLQEQAYQQQRQEFYKSLSYKPSLSNNKSQTTNCNPNALGGFNCTTY